MTTPKPSTPPAGPSGVSHTPALDLADVMARMNTTVETALRHLFDTLGIKYTEPIVEAKHEFTTGVPNHLDAMRQAWDEGYHDGTLDGREALGYTSNPYDKLLDDRREFVREQVENGYGAQLDENDDDVLGDNNAEWFDAILDAHDEWLALQRHIKPQDSGAWQPPYSADEALGKIWHLVKAGDSEATYDGVRAVLDEMGYHEHVHTRLAVEPDLTTIPPTMPQCGETQGREQTFDGRALICHLPTGHDGLHLDNTAGVTWS